VSDLTHQIDLVVKSTTPPGIPVSLPTALSRKYPGAGFSQEWRYLFPAKGPSVSPQTGNSVIHHMHPSTVQKEMRRAIAQSGIKKRAGVQTLRHCFATHLLIPGVELCEIQQLFGHRNLETTRIHIHIAKSLKHSIVSPLDMLSE